jgi:hypothetical protein
MYRANDNNFLLDFVWNETSIQVLEIYLYARGVPLRLESSGYSPGPELLPFLSGFLASIQPNHLILMDSCMASSIWIAPTLLVLATIQKN